jgi:hypothetical protein
MNKPKTLITIKKCAELTGLTEEAIRALKKKGHIRETIDWVKSRNGRIFIHLENFTRHHIENKPYLGGEA